MVGDGTSPPEKLLGRSCSPENPVVQTELDNLNTSELIAHRNFRDLSSYVDGPLNDGGWIIVSPDDEPEGLPLTALENERSKLYKHLHNYLASVYSFNEQVRELINRKIGDPGRMDSPLSIGEFVPNDRTLYTQELAFVRGLRVDAQHGEFAAIELTPATEGFSTMDEEILYWIQFDKEGFRNGPTRTPDKYLGNKADSSFGQPLEYLHRFHRNYFVEFARETEEWFETGVL